MAEPESEESTHTVNSLLHKFESLAQHGNSLPQLYRTYPLTGSPQSGQSSSRSVTPSALKSGYNGSVTDKRHGDYLSPNANDTASSDLHRFRSVSVPTSPRLSAYTSQESRPGLRPNGSSPNLSESVKDAAESQVESSALQAPSAQEPTVLELEKKKPRQPPPRPQSRSVAIPSRSTTPSNIDALPPSIPTTPEASPSYRRPPPPPSVSPRAAIPIPGAKTTSNSTALQPLSTPRQPSPIPFSASAPADLPLSSSIPSNRPGPPIPPRPQIETTSSVPPLPARKSTLQPSVNIKTNVLTKEPKPSSAPAAAPIGDSFVARPPPSRSVAGNTRVSPVRPIAARGNDSEDESEEEEGAFKADDIPDSTYASRRPPDISPPRRMNSYTNFTCVAARGDLICVGSLHHLKFFSIATGMEVLDIPLSSEQHRITAVAFQYNGELVDNELRRVWAGTRNGHLFEVDVDTASILETRSTVHASAISAIYRLQDCMITVDESAKVQIWPSVNGTLSLSATPRTQRMSDKINFATLIDSYIWTAAGPNSKQNLRTPIVRLYVPTRPEAFNFSSRPAIMPDGTSYISPSAVTGGAKVPLRPGSVYLSHESGHISCWDEETGAHQSTLRVASGAITCVLGVLKHLWVGFKTGTINVYDVDDLPWKVIKSWPAHQGSVTNLCINHGSLWSVGKLYVISTGSDSSIHVLDGFLADDWIDRELTVRQAEYCDFSPLRVLTCSWNIDACKPSQLQDEAYNANFLSTFLKSTDSPDIISFGLQEIIDLQSKALTAKSLILGRRKVEGKCQDSSISHNYQAWHEKLVSAVRLAMPADEPYSVIHAESLIGIYSCIFIKNSLKPQLRDIDRTTVKTGLGRRYGNKGAVISRFVIGDSSIAFINCHLAAGQNALRQRNKDLIGILETHSSLRVAADLEPNAYIGGGDGSIVNDHDICILSGDLNFRIDMRRDIVIDYAERKEFEMLLEQDQLLKQMRTNAAFRLRSFKEAPIDFAPTYKYDRGTHDYDSSEKQRAPAYCDRILWRTLAQGEDVVPLHYQRYEPTVSDHRPVSAALDFRIKQIGHSRRTTTRRQIFTEWQKKEQSLLERAKQYYGM